MANAIILTWYYIYFYTIVCSWYYLFMIAYQASESSPTHTNLIEIEVYNILYNGFSVSYIVNFMTLFYFLAYSGLTTSSTTKYNVSFTVNVILFG